MACIRLEWLALGWFGFDHLQLVFEPDGAPSPVPQDDWYVLEGNFGRAHGRVTLGVGGADGRTTLSACNGAKGCDLERRIGTPEQRGSVVLPAGGDPILAWQTMAAFARELDGVGHPYRSMGLVFPGYPVVNSSSVVASLLWRIGINIHDHLPAGIIFSPGTATLLAGSGLNSLAHRAPHFDTLIGGAGDDVLSGSAERGRVAKLFGGPGDDTFLWTPGLSIIHGGLPGLPEVSDGYDAVDYRGAGRIELSAPARSIYSRRTNFVVSFSGSGRGGGVDRLTSIEALYLDPATDTLVAGRNLARIPRSLAIEMRPSPLAVQSCGRADFSAACRGVTVTSTGDDSVEVTLGAGRRALCFKGLCHLTGSAHDDYIQMSPAMRVANGGPGDDVIDARLVAPGGASATYGYDAEIDGGPGDDVLIACRGRTYARGGSGRDTFILPAIGGGEARVATELVIADATPSDCLLVPAAVFGGQEGGSATRLRRLSGRLDDAAGAVRYEHDGVDLVIRLTSQDEGGGIAGSEKSCLAHAIVRILNYRDGDLGIAAGSG